MEEEVRQDQPRGERFSRQPFRRIEKQRQRRVPARSDPLRPDGAQVAYGLLDALLELRKPCFVVSHTRRRGVREVLGKIDREKAEILHLLQQRIHVRIESRREKRRQLDAMPAGVALGDRQDLFEVPKRLRKDGDREAVEGIGRVRSLHGRRYATKLLGAPSGWL